MSEVPLYSEAHDLGDNGEDLIRNVFQFKRFLAMKFTTRFLKYH